MNTPDLHIQQALVMREPRGARVVAATPEFNVPEAERIAVLFGARPAGVSCPLAHFACPFDKHHVAVVRVEDQPNGALGFRFLVLTRQLYHHLGDPFAISDRYPPDWSALGPLAELAWPMAPLPERTVEHLNAILKRGDVSLLLGGAQVLVDGSRVLLQRQEPAEQLIRDLWQLLPDRTRCTLWPATFAFSDELGFHAAAGPTFPPAYLDKYILTEDAIRDYPQSHYELHLQIAIENQDQAALRKLLARRTADDTIRLGLYILGFALVAATVVKFLF